MDDSIEATGTQEGGVEIVGPVGGSDEEDVGRPGCGPLQLTVSGEVPVDEVGETVPEPRLAARQVEALHLHEQLVHHAGDALASGAPRHALARTADGVELLDEADGAAFGAGRL